MIILWGFIFLLSLAVIFLTWMQFKNQGDEMFKQSEQVQLDQKVVNLEQNLKKTLEIMQDLAKKMHTQQEVLDQTTHKLQQVELQNAELVTLLAKVVMPKE
ncbi:MULTISPECIES: hypothetical protein [Acinetobacter]|uniref:DUF2570 domain-containing protein n=1 Tax=Acinetobacter chengduensis TaxID=2420890 RepID=A0ABX9TTY7_9GAMM|nr:MULTISPECIES: hypothetical protein [Acinetobacter]MBI1453005.1 hypothetical protein [Acinetobacter sp. FL51]RKG41381.1 hypothetical protein D7V31_10190 [Acinetobacter sp. WCHAc060007]RLL20391.1 hypothetical protein D9K81_12100 [Acinetobacter chengduensis]